MKMKSTFIKYLFTSLLIFFLPFLSLVIFFNAIFLGIYENDIIAYNNASVEKTKIIFDSHITQMQNLSLKILEQLPKEPTPEQEIGLISNLRSQVMIYSLIEDILVVDTGNQNIYTSYGTYNSHLFGERNRAFVELVTGGTSPVLFRNATPGLGVRKGIYLLVPYSRSNTYILFSLDNDSFQSVFSKLDADNFSYSIADAAGQPIFCSKGDWVSLDLGLHNMEPRSSGNYRYKSKTVYYTASDILPITYLSHAPIALLTRNVSKLNYLLAGVSAILLLVGLALIYWVNKRQYRPIAALTSMVRQHTDTPSGLNELDSAGYAIHNLSQNCHALRTVNEKIAAETVMLKLLNHNYQSAAGFIAACEDNGLEFWGDNYCALLLYSQSESGIQQAAQRVKDMLSVDMCVLMAEYQPRMQYILALAFDQEGGSNPRDKLLLVADAVNSSHVFVCVGNVYTDPLDIALSCNEAVTIVKYCDMAGLNQNICFYSELKTVRFQDYKYPKTELDTLYASLIALDTEKIRLILSILTNFIENTPMDIFSIKCLTYDIINTFLRALHELNITPPATLEQYSAANSLNSSSNAAELIKLIGQACDEVLEKLKPQNRKKIGDISIGEIVAFIEAHYLDNGFSVSTVAEELQITLSYLSHVFKSNTGQSISNYIYTLKMDMVKKLLLESSMPVKEIAERAGYFQTSSFIRMFKQVTGITPAQFRKNISKENLP